MQDRVRRRIGTGLIVAALIMLGVAIAMRFAADEAAERHDRVEQTHAVLDLLERSYSAIKDAESAQRGFLLTGRPDLEMAFFANGPESRALAQTLADALAEHAEQQTRARRFASLIDERLSVAAEVLKIYRSEGLEAARASVDSGKGLELMLAIEQLRDEMAAAERRALSDRNERADVAAGRFLLGVELGQGLSVLILALVAWRMLVEMRQREWAESETLASNQQLTEVVRDLERRNQQTRAMTEFAGMLQSCKSVGEALGVCHDAMLRLSPATGGSLYLMRHSQNLLELAAMWGEPEPASASFLPPDDCWAMRRGQRYQVSDVGSATACAHVEHADDVQQGSSYLCLPLIAQGQIMGLLHLRGSEEAIDGDAAVAGAAAEQLSLALSNLQLQESLRVLFERLPDIRLGGAPRYRDSFHFHGLERLECRW